MQPYRLALIASIAILGGSCDALGVTEVCTLELGVRYSPADTTIQVGQSFNASVQLLSCGGTKQLADVFTWHADDPGIAIVDQRTGTVIGQGPGTTRILASGERYGTLGGFRVSVEGVGP